MEPESPTPLDAELARVAHALTGRLVIYRDIVDAKGQTVETLYRGTYFPAPAGNFQ